MKNKHNSQKEKVIDQDSKKNKKNENQNLKIK